ncbi:MAG: hypothetical protein INQ03_03340 [Candidatus Heimdallarchaeota archaeon]|nr:hypothetical protein [Candidatus Heimdallarchaeota archaeon]
MSSERVQMFKEVTAENYSRCGGKGLVLIKLYKKKYSVPNGFIIFPEAFVNEKLTQGSQNEILKYLTKIREKRGNETKFAIRSSGFLEDSSDLSFAGEFDTILELSDDEDIFKSINIVYTSRNNERVRAYSKEHGIEGEHNLSVIVQEMIDADYSGVIFTADPVSGDIRKIMGNYVEGIGDVLVSGNKTPKLFEINKVTGDHSLEELKKYTKQILNLSNSLENEFNCPQDIEWAIKDNKFYILQSRPITTLEIYNAKTGEYNSSNYGNFLWANSNASEALPEVVTPSTWSIWSIFHNEISPFTFKRMSIAGNIGGRCYFNFSLLYSLYLLGESEKEARFKAEEFLGKIPEGFEIPKVNLKKFDLVRMLPRIIWYAMNLKKYKKLIPQYLEENVDVVNNLRSDISAAESVSELTDIWNQKLFDHMILSFWMIKTGSKKFFDEIIGLKKELKDCDDELTNALLSNLSGSNNSLSSLGPLEGLEKVTQGSMSKDEYISKYGHRSYNEAELYQDIEINLDDLIDSFSSEQSVLQLLENQKSTYHKSIRTLETLYPDKYKKIMTRIENLSQEAHIRESTRSESIRSFTVVREFFNQAGKLTNLGDNVFFLSLDELLDVLNGNTTPLEYMATRKETYIRYKTLPTYPALILGRFDPFVWSKDDKGRTDVFGFYENDPGESEMISGFPGASGIIEGNVRRIDHPREANQLVQGEILVTVNTNIGWTLIFPRCAAIVTDIGAPLSHAAIVARELGIPAVVGCGNATMRLKTGDIIRVNGSAGTITILVKK